MNAGQVGNRIVESMEFAKMDLADAFYIGLHLSFNFPEYARALYAAGGQCDEHGIEDVEALNEVLQVLVNRFPIEGAA